MAKQETDRLESRFCIDFIIENNATNLQLNIDKIIIYIILRKEHQPPI